MLAVFLMACVQIPLPSGKIGEGASVIHRFSNRVWRPPDFSRNVLKMI